MKKKFCLKNFSIIPNFGNLFQNEIYCFRRSYTFEESLYLLLKKKIEKLEQN